MDRNVEIKAKVVDLAAIRAKAAALASDAGEIIEQVDVFFGVPRGRLKIREFRDGSGELIAYERADDPAPKPSVYSRCACPDARLLAETLGAALPVRGTVVKRREVLHAGRTRIHLDQVQGLGAFVELEVVLAEEDSVAEGVREAHELLWALGIGEEALVAGAYVDLLDRNP